LNNTANKNSIIIIAESSILNPSEINVYQNLSVNYSVFLNTLLFSNWVEILSEIRNDFEIITFLDERDKEFLPKYFLPFDTKTIFYSTAQLSDLTGNVIKNIATDSLKNMVLFYNLIGLTINDIMRSFNLVQADEPSMVIGKSSHDKIVFTCTSGIDEDLLDPIFSAERKYSKYLNSISNKDLFINTLDNFLSIDDFEDIKKLYIELSKKESLSYCSPKMHESFNDLFIEYKELLDV
jgi:hypothetical protein